MRTLFSVHPTTSPMNFSAFRTHLPELSSSLIAEHTRSLSFDSFIGYPSKAEFVSSSPPVHTKRFLPTPHTTLLHLATITNLSILFAPLTSIIFTWLRLAPTLFSLIPLSLSCHLELNSSRNPLVANHWNLQMQPKDTLLLLLSRLGHLLPVHQIQFILTFARKYRFTFTLQCILNTL